jgi:hypothetical protein
MKTLIAAAALFYFALCLLTGCGSEITYRYEYRGLTIESELPLNEEKLHSDIDFIASSFADEGLLRVADFETKFVDLPIWVSDVAVLEVPPQATGRLWQFPYLHIELNRGGGSLGHELMHVLGYTHTEDAPYTWNDDRAQRLNVLFAWELGNWHSLPAATQPLVAAEVNPLRIKVGMTEAEARSIGGAPDQVSAINSPFYGDSLWHYSLPCGDWYVTLDDGIVTSRNGLTGTSQPVGPDGRRGCWAIL